MISSFLVLLLLLLLLLMAIQPCFCTLAADSCSRHSYNLRNLKVADSEIPITGPNSKPDESAQIP
jgi:hypothetical protein